MGMLERFSLQFAIFSKHVQWHSHYENLKKGKI